MVVFRKGEIGPITRIFGLVSFHYLNDLFIYQIVVDADNVMILSFFFSVRRTLLEVTNHLHICEDTVGEEKSAVY